MTSALWIVGVAVAAVLFYRSAETGEGWASRVVQLVYYRIGSLESYRKSGRVHESAEAVLRASGEPALRPLVERIAPSQVGWFSRRLPTDKGTYHGYLPIYDAVLAPYREVPGLRVLEVGVKKGGSLVLWRELFDESAFIYGIDVNPDVPRFSRDAHMKVLVLDSRDEEAVRAALRGLELDVIIDDGHHHPESQHRTWLALRPHLAPTGVYVIEDVYELEPERYADGGFELVVHPDRSGQSLVVLYPPASRAGRVGASVG